MKLNAHKLLKALMNIKPLKRETPVFLDFEYEGKYLYYQVNIFHFHPLSCYEGLTIINLN